jgi:aconitate hydratase
MLEAPLPPEEARKVSLTKGPNIASLPLLSPLPSDLRLEILLKLGDNISTDEIMPAGARVLPFRSNIPKISEFCFEGVDPTYHQRALATREEGGHAIVGGENYGQGSSREHAALAPRFLGLHCVITKSFARIHWQNLINFGILPLTFVNPEDGTKLNQGDVIVLNDVPAKIRDGNKIDATVETKDFIIPLEHSLSKRQVEVLLDGGMINWTKKHY